MVVSHLVQKENTISVDLANNRFVVEGQLCRRKTRLPNPWTNICFRLLTLTLGRFAPNLIRAVLQKVLITGKPVTSLRFRRVLEFRAEGITVEDSIDAAAKYRRISCGSDATSIYVANSNVYQESVLCPWQHADWTALPIVDGWRIWRRQYKCLSDDGIESKA